MAVWFLAPLAVVGAKIAWDYYNKDDDRASSSNSSLLRCKYHFE